MKPRPTSLVLLAMIFSGGAVCAGAQEPIATTQLTDHLYLLTTDQGAYTTNSIVSVGEDGVLLVDTQAADVAEDLEKVVEGFGKGAPKIIINTHRHVEHVGGNAVFGAGPVIIAHELVPQKLRSGSYLFEEFPDAALPDITFNDSMTLFFNGDRIELHEMAGSHDDNEIMVHFTDSKVVHLSSLVNGFNFPSIDSDGSALAFPRIVARALEMLPEDVQIVSGHNRVGSMDDLRDYHYMLGQTIAAIWRGLADGKDVATLQQEKVLDPWESYAGSYVSSDEWIEYVAEALEPKEKKPTVFEPLYYAMKEGGAEAVIARYDELKIEHADDYDFGELDLLVVGQKMQKKGDTEGAVRVLESSVERYPEGDYTYYCLYLLARAYQTMGEHEQALAACKKALELEPENATLGNLLAELEDGEG